MDSVIFMAESKHHRYIPGKKKYVFIKSSFIYPEAFKAEKTRLSKSINGVSFAIEHFGSTAVPNLGGKNILDILIGLKNGLKNRNRQEMKSRLEGLGYDFIPDAGSPRRFFFIRDIHFKGKPIRIHLHLVKFSGTEWNQKIAFRDYLRKHKELVSEYEKVKKDAVKMANGDKTIYLKVKSGFINRVTRDALKSRK